MKFDFTVNAPKTGAAGTESGANAGMAALATKHRGNMGLLAATEGFSQVAERVRREGVQERFQERSAELAAEEQEKRRQAAADLHFQGERLKNISAEEMQNLQDAAAGADEEEFSRLLDEAQARISRRFEDPAQGYQNRQRELNGENFANMTALARDGFAVSARAWHRGKQKTDDAKKAALLGARAAEDMDADGMNAAAAQMLAAGVPKEVAEAQMKQWELTALKAKIASGIADFEAATAAAGYDADKDAQARAGVFAMISESGVTAARAQELRTGADARFAAVRDAYQKSAQKIADAQAKAYREQLNAFDKAFDDDSGGVAAAAYAAAKKFVAEASHLTEAEKALALSDLETEYRKGRDAAQTRLLGRVEANREAVYSETGELLNALRSGDAGLADVRAALLEKDAALGGAFPRSYGEELEKRPADAPPSTISNSQDSALNAAALMRAISEYDPKKDADGLLLHKFFRDAAGNCEESDARAVLNYLAWKSGASKWKPTTVTESEARNYIFAELGLTDKEKRESALAGECFRLAMKKLCGMTEPLSATQFYAFMPQIMPQIKRIYDGGENAQGLLALTERYESRLNAAAKRMRQGTTAEAAQKVFSAAEAAEEEELMTDN